LCVSPAEPSSLNSNHSVDRLLSLILQANNAEEITEEMQRTPQQLINDG
jgi:hypothetical protein